MFSSNRIMKDMSLVVAYKLVIYLADFLEDVFWSRNQAQLKDPDSEEVRIFRGLSFGTLETHGQPTLLPIPRRPK